MLKHSFPECLGELGAAGLLHYLVCHSTKARADHQKASFPCYMSAGKHCGEDDVV